jgi:hypothetical protein
MEAAYVFRVRFRLEPRGLRVTPDEFETVAEWPAPAPGEPGWRLFHEHLWRGEASDPAHLRELFADRLGVAVAAVSFSELRTDRAYLDAFEAAIAADLDRFGGDSVREVRHRHLGSSVRVVDAE